jgi:hypothetical protein
LHQLLLFKTIKYMPMASTTTPTDSTTPGGIISGGIPGGIIAGSIRLQESITKTPLEVEISHHFSNPLIILYYC